MISGDILQIEEQAELCIINGNYQTAYALLDQKYSQKFVNKNFLELKLLAAQLSGNQSNVLTTLKEICDIYATTSDFTINQLNKTITFDNVNYLLNKLDTDGSYQIGAKFIGFDNFQYDQQPIKNIQIDKNQLIQDLMKNINQNNISDQNQIIQTQPIEDPEEKSYKQKIQQAQSLIDNQSYQDAIQVLQQMKLTDQQVLHLLFLCLKRCKQYEEIVNLSLIYKQYLSVDDLSLLAYSLAKINKLQDAVEIYNECENMYQQVPISTLFNKALCLFRLGNLIEANNYIDKVLLLDNNMQEAKQLKQQILRYQ